jgi:thymidylate synthase ThyX
MKITFPRFILAEFNTHRMLSKNSASSRAIPFKKMVKMVEENPFIPIAWQKDHKGMQGTEYWNEPQSNDHTDKWLIARDKAVEIASAMNYSGVTKQLCNRLLEPFMWHTVIVTGTEWDNFFNLRCPQYYYEGNRKTYKSKKELLPILKEDLGNYEPGAFFWQFINKSQAEIHIQAIAELMWDAYNESTPKYLNEGEWHIPFGDNIDEEWINNYLDEYDYDKSWLEMFKVKIATARCARISYETLGDNPKIDYEADIRLHDMLLESEHMSPFEHCAKAMTEGELYTFNFKCRNFKGFTQYRHIIENN